MITPGLEKLVFENGAIAKTFNGALTNFYALNFTEKVIVIHQIDWTPFINSNNGNLTELLRDYLAQNEYQLRISSGLGDQYLQYQNNLKLLNGLENPAGNGFNMDDTLNNCFENGLILQPGDPIIKNCFIVCKDYAHFVITRNLIKTEIRSGSAAGLLESSTEKNFPLGIKDFAQIQYFQADTSPNNEYFEYMPPTPKNFGFGAMGALATYGYLPSQYIHLKGTGAASGLNQMFYPPDVVPRQLRNVSFPLFTIHYVEMNKNLANNLNSY